LNGPRGLDKNVIRALVQESDWVAKHENVFVLGPTGVGKGFVTSALAQKADAMVTQRNLKIAKTQSRP